MSWWDENVTGYVQRQEIAAIAGAVLGALNAPGQLLREKVYNVAAGFAAALYLAPPAIELLHVPTDAGKTAFVFTTGLLGMNVLVKMIDKFKDTGLGPILDYVFEVILRLKKAPPPPSEDGK